MALRWTPTQPIADGRPAPAHDGPDRGPETFSSTDAAVAQTLDDCEAILEGTVDDLPAEAFRYAGPLSEVRERAEKDARSALADAETFVEALAGFLEQQGFSTRL